MKKDELTEEFVAMLNRCQRTLLGLCAVHTDRNPDSIDDLYQDIVSNLWEAFPKFRRESTFSTWAFRIALNTIYRYHRTRRRRPTFVYLDEELLDSIPDNVDDEQMQTLYRLIDRLDDSDKTLVFLYIDELPQSEIASILGISGNAVENRIKRIKTKLRKMYENEQ